jgi:hypothetical protein
VAATVAIGVWANTLRLRLDAKATLSHMNALWVICEDSAATDLDEVLEECARIGVSCVDKDAWGHRYVVETRPSTGAAQRCVVISLGRDGARGPCCRGSMGWHWDEDAARGKEWLQSWNYMSSGKDEPLAAESSGAGRHAD